MVTHSQKKFPTLLAVSYQPLRGYAVFLAFIVESTVDDNLTTTEDYFLAVSAALSFAAACFSNSKLT